MPTEEKHYTSRLGRMPNMMLPHTQLWQGAILFIATTLVVLADVPVDPGTEELHKNRIIIPYAEISQGVLKGVTMQTNFGRQYFAFLGIPYAKPPVGNLRFQAPVPAGGWDGVRNATVDAPECIQKNYLIANANVTGQEDCLYLNVYTPKLSPPYGLLPVMVYIHGGGLFSGTGASYIQGPNYLLNKDIVLVTFNYRLGALGFLSTGDSAAPGNAGLKDQVEVLKWVNLNIATFGGDPTCVTLFGQSAGATSVHFHMLSPLSKGLFHRAITESGTALAAWVKPVPPLPIATKQAQLVKCPTSNTEEMVGCLQRIDAKVLVDSGDAFHEWSIDTLVTFRPVIETGPGCFLPDDPVTLISNQQFTNIPWINGVVSQEGIIRAIPIVTNATLLSDLNSRPNELFPFLMDLPASAKRQEDVPAIWENITQFYFQTSTPNISEENVKQFINLYSDRSFLQGFYKAAVLHSRFGHLNQYLYNFAYRGNYSYTSVFAPTTKNYGVSHCDELLYLFDTPVLFPGWNQGERDLEVVKTLISLWTSFAKNGKPTLDVAPKEDLESASCYPECTKRKRSPRQSSNPEDNKNTQSGNCHPDCMIRHQSQWELYNITTEEDDQLLSCFPECIRRQQSQRKQSNTEDREDVQSASCHPECMTPASCHPECMRQKQSQQVHFDTEHEEDSHPEGCYPECVTPVSCHSECMTEKQSQQKHSNSLDEKDNQSVSCRTECMRRKQPRLEQFNTESDDQPVTCHPECMRRKRSEPQKVDEPTSCLPECTSQEQFRWEPYNPTACGDPETELRFLNITAAPAGSTSILQFCMQKGFLQDRLNFWESLPLKENASPSSTFSVPHIDQLFYYFY